MRGLYFIADTTKPPDVIVYYCHGEHTVALGFDKREISF